MTHRVPVGVVYVGTSLDGFIARKDGGIDWLGEPTGDDDFGWAEFMAGIDHIVMGRNTFEMVVGFGVWPYEGIPLTVLTTTLTDVPQSHRGKATVSAESPTALMARLGAAGARRVYVDGGQTVKSFMRAGLIDELQLTTIPVLIGEGIPLFGPLDADIHWEFESAETYPGGLVKRRYRRKEGPA